MMKLIPKSVRRIALGALLVVPGVVAFAACTDLTEVPRDALTPDNAFKNDAEVLAGVASVYAGLRGTMWGYYNLSEVTTDEMIVPTRGSDWYDNGRWLEIHRQKWGANSVWRNSWPWLPSVRTLNTHRSHSAKRISGLVIPRKPMRPMAWPKRCCWFSAFF